MESTDAGVVDEEGRAKSSKRLCEVEARPGNCMMSSVVRSGGDQVELRQSSPLVKEAESSGAYCSIGRILFEFIRRLIRISLELVGSRQVTSWTDTDTFRFHKRDKAVLALQDIPSDYTLKSSA